MRKTFYLLILATLFYSSCIPAKQLPDRKPVILQNNDAARRQFEYFFYEGLKHKDNQQLDQAIESFRLCIALDSLDAGAQSEMGILYASIGLTNEAVVCFEKAVQFDKDNWWYSVRLISAYSNLREWQKAIGVAGLLQKKHPYKEDVYDMLATLYKQTKEFDKAIAAYDKLEALTGIEESTSFEKFQLYILSDKPKKGIAEIDKLINKYPTESRYRILRGDIFMQQKMPEMAYAAYQKVLTEDPQNAYVYVSLSEYYKLVNQPDKAMEAIVSALKSEQLSVETKVDVLGQYVEKLLKDTTKFAETESLFKLLVDRYPLEEKVHGYYALFLQFRNRNSEAEAELETMLNINPKNEQTWMRLLQMNVVARNYNQILTITARATENLPKVSSWYFYRGVAQVQLNDYQSALVTFQAAIPLLTTEQAALKSDFYAQIADVYYKLQKKDSAFAYYENALNANSQNIMVMNNYAYYLSLEKAELKKAEKMSAKTVELEPKNSTFLDTYAWILYQQGNFSLAKFYIEKAVDNLPKDDDPGVVLEHYGDILWMNGKGDVKSEAKALEMWQKSYDSGNKTDELKHKIENKGWNR